MMQTKFKTIRERLGMTQAAIASALGMTQGNVSLYEVRGQTVTPEVAAKLIELCRSHGIEIGFDHLYDDAVEVPAA